MGNEPEWKVDKQPAWLVAAIKKTITELPGGYVEAAEWLGTTENALFNRLRTGGIKLFLSTGRLFYSVLVVLVISLMQLLITLTVFL